MYQHTIVTLNHFMYDIVNCKRALKHIRSCNVFGLDIKRKLFSELAEKSEAQTPRGRILI